jgi:hypothetical protein
LPARAGCDILEQSLAAPDVFDAPFVRRLPIKIGDTAE